MSSQTSEKLQVLRGDVFGGLTAAVVALPLSLAFGVASGLGAVAGLYGAIVVGLLGALLGGSKTQISGPTAPLSVAMAVVFVDYANQDLGKALAIVALAGLIQVLMGALRLGSYMAYTPYAVVSGFTSAVGLIIILVQFLPLLGSEVALGGALKSLRSWPEAVSNVDPSALALGLVSLAICIFWPERFRKFMPPSVAALLIGTLLAVLWLSDVPTLAEVPAGLPDIKTAGTPTGRHRSGVTTCCDDRLARFDQQLAHCEGGRLADPPEPRAQPGIDGRGIRQRACGPRGWRAWRGSHVVYRGQRPCRGPVAGLRGVVCNDSCWRLCWGWEGMPMRFRTPCWPGSSSKSASTSSTGATSLESASFLAKTWLCWR